MTLYKNYPDDDRPIVRHEVQPLSQSDGFAGLPESQQLSNLPRTATKFLGVVPEPDWTANRDTLFHYPSFEELELQERLRQAQETIALLQGQADAYRTVWSAREYIRIRTGDGIMPVGDLAAYTILTRKLEELDQLTVDTAVAIRKKYKNI